MTKQTIGGSIWLLCTFCSLPPSRAATYLVPSTKTRSSNVDSESIDSVSSSSSSSTKIDQDAEIEDDGLFEIFSFDPFEMTDIGWNPPRLRTSVEFGLLHWEPFSRSGQYDASYDIDPVFTTIVETSVQVKGWLYSFDYTTSLGDPEQIKNLMAQVSRFDPGEGAWWSLYA